MRNTYKGTLQPAALTKDLTADRLVANLTNLSWPGLLLMIVLDEIDAVERMKVVSETRSPSQSLSW